VAKVFSEKDRNHDGKLNFEELIYVPIDQRPPSSPPQKAAAPKAAEISKVPRAPEAPKAMEIPKAAEESRPGTAGNDRAERLFRNFDMNHDGFVSLDEYRQGMTGNMAESRIEKVFKEKDRNGDGKLTLDELLYVPTDQKAPAPSPLDGKRGTSKIGSAGR
jgi:Ca2+-binding EF-hand superfamily protein